MGKCFTCLKYEVFPHESVMLGSQMVYISFLGAPNLLKELTQIISNLENIAFEIGSENAVRINSIRKKKQKGEKIEA